MNRRRQPTLPPDSILKQIEAAEKVLSFAKLILCAFAALLLWAARLQWNVADLQVKVAEIQEDRRVKITDNDKWKREIDLANVHRDEAIAALAKAQAETARTNRAR